MYSYGRLFQPSAHGYRYLLCPRGLWKDPSLGSSMYIIIVHWFMLKFVFNYHLIDIDVCNGWGGHVRTSSLRSFMYIIIIPLEVYFYHRRIDTDVCCVWEGRICTSGAVYELLAWDHSCIPSSSLACHVRCVLIIVALISMSAVSEGAVQELLA